jgi:Zinc dependent phospholipase C
LRGHFRTEQRLRAIPCVLFVFALAKPLRAYSVLSHEAIIDALWDTGLKEILIERFRNSTPEQLKEAHAYAYGGAIIQDMGYYPHGNGYFSDLTHYARAGDFIEVLIRESQTLDEYAFALGALSHYATDNEGHRLATNIGEPLIYPKLKQKFGKLVTYEDDPYAHLRTEYAFDVEQVVKGNFAPEAYHDFIGFGVAKPLLERAFQETYGFPIKQVVPDLDNAIGSYRHTLSTLIPFFTRVAWANHEGEIRKARPTVTRKEFLYVMSRSSYEHEWGKQYDRPSFFDRIVAFIVKLLPPIGELKILKFRVLTPPVEALFMKSFEVATREYRRNVHEADHHSLDLENRNFDVGVVTRPGQYKLQDQTYSYWLDELNQSKYTRVTPAITQDILVYYSDLSAPITTKAKRKDWQRVLSELDELRASAASSGQHE